MNQQEFLDGYIECALWSSNDESNDQGGDPLDRNYTASDIHPDTLKVMESDCKAFIDQNEATLGKAEYNQREYTDSEMAGHDFWLTRNGHGAGFWDSDIDKEVGKALTKACEPFGEFNLYVGDDKQIHGSKG